MDQFNIPPSQPQSSPTLSQEKPGLFPQAPFTSPFPSPAPLSPFSAPPPVANNRPKNSKKILIGLAILVLLAGLALLIISLFFKKSLVKEPTTLNYWGLFEPASVFQQVIDDYEKTHPKIKINYTQEDLKYYQPRLISALGRGEGPDIFRIHQSWVPAVGDYLSLTLSSVYDQTNFEKDFYPSVKDSLKYKGQYVAIPLEFDGLALFYNEDLFKAVGLTPPKTWRELKKAACELTVKDEQGKIRTAGIALGTTSNVDHWPDILGLMMLQNGANLANPAFCTKEGEGGATPGGEVCLGKDSLVFYTFFTTDQACEGETVNPGSVWSSSLPASTYSFSTGSLAMYFGPSWRIFDIKAANPNLNFKVVPVPQLEGGNIAWSSYWVETVSKNSKYQKESWEFLKYLSSSEVLQKLYKTESNLRLFGEPYSRVELSSLLKDQPYVGSFIEQAPIAQNWYLSSNTNDDLINKQMIKYYEDAVNAVNNGGDPTSALSTASLGVIQVLKQYGLSK